MRCKKKYNKIRNLNRITFHLYIFHLFTLCIKIALKIRVIYSIIYLTNKTTNSFYNDIKEKQ